MDMLRLDFWAMSADYLIGRHHLIDDPPVL